jgi:hypothetical protein
MNGRSKSREVDPVKRREIIAGLVPAGVSSAAEEHDTKSFYIPRTQLIEDRRDADFSGLIGQSWDAIAGTEASRRIAEPVVFTSSYAGVPGQNRRAARLIA